MMKTFRNGLIMESVGLLLIVWPFMLPAFWEGDLPGNAGIISILAGVVLHVAGIIIILASAASKNQKFFYTFYPAMALVLFLLYGLGVIG